MRALLRVLDSKFLSRVGNLDALVKVVAAGASFVIACAVVGAGVVKVAGWIPLACFVVWAVLTGLLVATGMLRSGQQAFTSPAARIAIAHGLPGEAGRVVAALSAAQKEGRELIADIAVFDTLNKSGGGFGQRIATYRGEVAKLIEFSSLLSDDWALMWDRIPRNEPAAVTYGPLTLREANEIVNWLRYKMWQLEWMVVYIQTGDDKPVRRIRMLAAASDREATAAQAGTDGPAASTAGDPIAPTG